MLTGVVRPATTVRTARFGSNTVGPTICALARLVVPEKTRTERPTNNTAVTLNQRFLNPANCKSLMPTAFVGVVRRML
jgi:hypothetical protein